MTLYNKQGRPRRNFRWDEKLRILGCTEAELDSFVREYAPRREGYIITRVSSEDPRDWTTPLRPPSEQKMREMIVRHLLGDRLPGLRLQWIGTKAWPTTMQVVIDVDRHGVGDKEFQARCARVENILARLDIDLSHCLLTPTPSGGRHYRVFLSKSFPTDQLPTLLAMAGLPNLKGVHEVYPSTMLGLRLPFGHIPHAPHRPREWRQHIRQLRRGRIRRYDPEWLWFLAERHANACPAAACSAGMMPAAAASTRGARQHSSNAQMPPVLGVTKADQQALVRYAALLARKTQHPREIEELWQLGILKEGTRVEVLGRLTWHLVHARHQGEEQAVEALTRWTYEPGRHASKDIRTDLANGTRHVEAQIRDLVRWHLAKQADSPNPKPAKAGERRGLSKISDGHTAITGSDIEAIMPYLRNKTGKERRLLALFAVHILVYAKSHGTPTPEGWQSYIATHGVLRKFPGCSGTRAHDRMEWAKAAGFIEVTQEKLQSPNGTGRARRYLIRVPAADPTAETTIPPPHRNHSPEEAVAMLALASTAQTQDQQPPDSRPPENDRYLVCCSTSENNTEREDNQRSGDAGESRHRHRQCSESSPLAAPAALSCSSSTMEIKHDPVPIVPLGIPKRFRVRGHFICSPNHPAGASPAATRTESHPPNPCYPHPQRPLGHLGQSTAERLPERHAGQAIPDATHRR